MVSHLHNSVSCMFQPESLPSILLQAADTVIVVAALQQGWSGGRQSGKECQQASCHQAHCQAGWVRGGYQAQWAGCCPPTLSLQVSTCLSLRLVSLLLVCSYICCASMGSILFCSSRCWAASWPFGSWPVQCTLTEALVFLR